VYRNVSLDGGATFGPDIKVADHSCECCRIALIDDGHGGLAAMWRHVFGTNTRDHGFAKISSKGERSGPVVRATFDDWHIDACPHHGPGLALTNDGGFHAVWFGVRKDAPGVRYARLDANGKPREPVRPIPDASAEHATVVSSGPNVVVLWRSFDGERTRFNAWISSNDGRTFVQKTLGDTALESDHPLLVRRDNKIVALWRTREEVRVVPVIG
jgi:hypothetical protein